MNLISRTILNMITVLVFMVFFGLKHANAQDKVYGYGYAYSHSKKEFYISNIVNGAQKSNEFHDASATDLRNQWHDKFKSEVQGYNNYHISATGFIGKSVSDYDQIDKSRTKMIADYRQQGFTIYQINGFRYHGTKKNR